MTTTVSKSQRRYVGSSDTKNFFSEGQKNLVNSENKENLSNYQLLKRKPSFCSISLHFSKLITVVQFFFLRDTGCAMVSTKFWRGKFSRQASGFECIAHAQTFDRGVVTDVLIEVLCDLC